MSKKPSSSPPVSKLPALAATTVPVVYVAQQAYRLAFFASLTAMLLTLWISGWNVGYNSDELDMNNYGKANYAWYASGGKDVSFLGDGRHSDISHVDSMLRYYGSDFDYIAVGINKITGLEKGRQEMNSRHVVCQLFAVLAILFAGLIARLAGGWPAAIFTAWLLFLTPSFFGHALFNTKDIPFCTGYIASLYFIITFLRQLPAATWRTAAGLMLSLAFTMGTRVGGVILIGYLALFTALYLAADKAVRQAVFSRPLPALIKLGVAVGGSLILMALLWPYVLQAPLTNLQNALGVVKNFPVKIKVLFGGEEASSVALPAGYLPTFMLITVPVFILFSIAAGLW